MQWRWRKIEIRYVPIPAWGRYADLWQDKGYLTDALHLGDAKVFQVEVTQFISDIRDKQDAAQTVESVKAYGECVALAKSLLTLSSRARQRLDDILFIEKRAKEQDAENA